MIITLNCDHPVLDILAAKHVFVAHLFVWNFDGTQISWIQEDNLAGQKASC